MEIRPASNRAQISAPVGILGTAVTGLVARVFGTVPAIGIAAVLVLAFILWAVVEVRRERAWQARCPLAVDRVGPSAEHATEYTRFRRVRVVNNGSRTVSKIEVKLTDCVQQQATFYPVKLPRMNGGAHPFDLDPGDSVYIDLIAIMIGGKDYLMAHDASVSQPNNIRIQPLDVSIRLTAKDLPSTSHHFKVHADPRVRSPSSSLRFDGRGQAARVASER